ncbi:hypothetical protein [Cryobacterium sp. M25]|uniref:hypothetical protein n=1 Tax=Cryobacterium sp. M25 TaxID=2048293 RepID=UPI0018EBAE45|nr:hypothetical protein [Cryobacterium sp. M25]
MQLLKIAGEADPGRVFGGRRPAVRVIVTEKALTAEPGEPGAAEPAAHGQIEGNPVPISQETIDRLLCDTGTRGIKFDDIGQIIDVGRDERLFTEAQRAAMGVRDGGCLWVGCDRSPAWSEAHHINEWLTDSGDTNLGGSTATDHRPGAKPTTSTNGSQTAETPTSPTECCSATRTTCCCTTSTGRSPAQERNAGCGHRWRTIRSRH